MITISNGNVTGCAVFPPGMLARGRTFKVIEIASATRYAWLWAIFHVAMMLVGVSAHDSEHFLSKWITVIFAYVIFRVFRTKRVSVNVVTENVSYSLAPISVWVDHFSYYSMLLLGIFLTNNYLMPPYDPVRIFAVICALFVTFVGAGPIWSYSVYRRNNCRKLGRHRDLR